MPDAIKTVESLYCTVEPPNKGLFGDQRLPSLLLRLKIY